MGFTTSSCSDIAEDVEMRSTEDVDMKYIDVDDSTQGQKLIVVEFDYFQLIEQSSQVNFILTSATAEGRNQSIVKFYFTSKIKLYHDIQVPKAT